MQGSQHAMMEQPKGVSTAHPPAAAAPDVGAAAEPPQPANAAADATVSQQAAPVDMPDQGKQTPTGATAHVAGQQQKQQDQQQLAAMPSLEAGELPASPASLSAAAAASGGAAGDPAAGSTAVGVAAPGHRTAPAGQQGTTAAGSTQGADCAAPAAAAGAPSNTTTSSTTTSSSSSGTSSSSSSNSSSSSSTGTSSSSEGDSGATSTSSEAAAPGSKPGPQQVDSSRPPSRPGSGRPASTSAPPVRRATSRSRSKGRHQRRAQGSDEARSQSRSRSASRSPVGRPAGRSGSRGKYPVSRSRSATPPIKSRPGSSRGRSGGAERDTTSKSRSGSPGGLRGRRRSSSRRRRRSRSRSASHTPAGRDRWRNPSSKRDSRPSRQASDAQQRRPGSSSDGGGGGGGGGSTWRKRRRSRSPWRRSPSPRRQRGRSSSAGPQPSPQRRPRSGSPQQHLRSNSRSRSPQRQPRRRISRSPPGKRQQVSGRAHKRPAARFASRDSWRSTDSPASSPYQGSEEGETSRGWARPSQAAAHDGSRRPPQQQLGKSRLGDSSRQGRPEGGSGGGVQPPPADGDQQPQRRGRQDSSPGPRVRSQERKRYRSSSGARNGSRSRSRSPVGPRRERRGSPRRRVEYTPVKVFPWGTRRPPYIPAGKPENPKLPFWRTREGWVHDRNGNAWDEETGEKVKVNGVLVNELHKADAAVADADAGDAQQGAAVNRGGNDTQQHQQQKASGFGQQQSRRQSSTPPPGRARISNSDRREDGSSRRRVDADRGTSSQARLGRPASGASAGTRRASPQRQLRQNSRGAQGQAPDSPGRRRPQGGGGDTGRERSSSLPLHDRERVTGEGEVPRDAAAGTGAAGAARDRLPAGSTLRQQQLPAAGVVLRPVARGSAGRTPPPAAAEGEEDVDMEVDPPSPTTAAAAAAAAAAELAEDPEAAARRRARMKRFGKGYAAARGSANGGPTATPADPSAAVKKPVGKEHHGSHKAAPPSAAALPPTAAPEGSPLQDPAPSPPSVAPVQHKAAQRVAAQGQPPAAAAGGATADRSLAGAPSPASTAAPAAAATAAGTPEAHGSRKAAAGGAAERSTPAAAAFTPGRPAERKQTAAAGAPAGVTPVRGVERRPAGAAATPRTTPVRGGALPGGKSPAAAGADGGVRAGRAPASPAPASTAVAAGRAPASPASTPAGVGPGSPLVSSLRLDMLGGLDGAYMGVAKQALQYNLLHLHLDGNYKAADTLRLEAISLKHEAEQRAEKAGRRWDVRSLVTFLTSGIKFLEWANTFRTAAGVGVATGTRQQQHRQALGQACEILNAGVARAESCLAARAISGAARCHTDVALSATKLLADKLAAIASMHYLFAGSQVFNTALRTLQGGGNAGASSAAGSGGSEGVDGAAAGGMDVMGAVDGSSPSALHGRQHLHQHQLQLQQQPALGNGAAGRPRGVPDVAGVGAGGPSPGESGTQNSASSAVDLMPPPIVSAGSTAAVQVEAARAVEQYVMLAGRWERVAQANERFMQQVMQQQQGGAAGRSPRLESEAAAASNHSTEALQLKVGQLLLAVGFEMGMWDLLSVLATASQACQAVRELAAADVAAGAGPEAAPRRAEQVAVPVGGPALEQA